MKQAALYICYYHITEPLVETQVVTYLRELARSGYEMHLLTFERKRMAEDQIRTTRARLAGDGIYWHALRYHKRPSLPATLYDIATGAIAAARICRKHEIRLVHARSHVPAAMALPLKRLLGARFLFDFRGLLAEEYVDAGHWRPGGLKFRLTKGMERRFFRDADAIVMLTNRIKDELVRTEPALHNRQADIQVIPCCVDLTKFSITAEERASYRRERGWTDRIVLAYVGKLGTWYLPDEMARFFSVARASEPRFFFQVLTQGDPTPIKRALQSGGVPAQDFDIRFEGPERLPIALAASDAGISFIHACNSKRASSPTKIGEYLAAGLPVLVNAGIGDCDAFLQAHRLGAIIDDFTHTEFRRATAELLVLIQEDRTSSRCQGFAARQLSVARIGGPRYLASYQRLLGASDLASALHVSETV